MKLYSSVLLLFLTAESCYGSATLFQLSDTLDGVVNLLGSVGVSKSTLYDKVDCPSCKCTVTTADSTSGYCATVASTTSVVNTALALIKAPLLSSLISDKYDFIIVGGGTSGCVLANRLSANPNVKVLLIEAGPNETAYMRVPTFAPDVVCTLLNYGDYSVPSDYGKGLNDGRMACPTGRVLGGSSYIGDMIYNRGSKAAFDEWGDLGLPDWYYDKVLQYFKRSEKALHYVLDSKLHGNDGPMNVQNTQYSQTTKQLEQGCRDMGLEVLDYNGYNQRGCSRLQYYANNGYRVDTNLAYLSPVVYRANLDVLYNTKVVNLAIDSNNRVYGVRYCAGPGEKLLLVEAKKEVIITAGALRSPQLLMLSGIGKKSDLHQAGIPVRVESNVGYNLHDTPGYGGLIYRQNKVPNQIQVATYTLPYLVNGDSLYSQPFSYGGLAVFDESKQMLSAESSMFNFLGQRATAYNFNSTAFNKWGTGENDAETELLSQMIPLLVKPKSRGYVKLNPQAPYHRPIIDLGYYTHPDDLPAMQECIQMGQDMIEKAEIFRKLDAKLYSKPVPGCESHPDYQLCALQHMTFSYANMGGTCKMGRSNDASAVVDMDLRVRGVTGVRVADASVVPHPLSTCRMEAATIMIGEYCAQKIIDEYESL